MSKRLLDLVLATAVLIVTSPLWVLIALAVLLDSGLPVFYRAQRVGRNGSIFSMFKFRTMSSSDGGPGITGASDARITKVGRFLRGWKLDELPQLLNVLRGEMSLVGPRPEDPRYVALYDEEQREVLKVRPGMTSPAAIRYRHEEQMLLDPDEIESIYVGSIMREKLVMDLEYVRTRSTARDLAILLRSIGSLFRGKEEGT